MTPSECDCEQVPCEHTPTAGDAACPDDPDGLHYSGCGCEVDPIDPNYEQPTTCHYCGHTGVSHDEHGQCWHTDDKGDEDCGCLRLEGDLVHHEPTEHCICGPTPEPVKRDDGSIGWVHVHHSLDNREAAEMTTSSDRIRLFLEEQASLGRDGRYEIWGGPRRPQTVITLGDLRALIGPPAVTHRNEQQVPTPGECRPGWHSVRYLTAEQVAEQGFPEDTWAVCAACGHRWAGAR